MFSPLGRMSGAFGFRAAKIFFDMYFVAENIFAGKERTKGLALYQKKQIEMANAVLSSLQQPISATDAMYSLRVGQQQVVEIAKSGINENLLILIMDEPTSSLSNTEVDVLFRLIEDLAWSATRARTLSASPIGARRWS